ncbi:hypothetical protein MKW92_022761 [Papaver armeniacum]|nr:hypothetical protein MKW92_022761 [Papaver armeniacum]
MGSFSQMLIKILSTILIFINIQYCYVNAQIDTSNIFPLCSGGNITSNTYRSNLKLLLSSLTNSFNKTIILNGYYNNTVGRKPNTAYGNYQCRGDITLEECRSNVDLAVKEVQQSCPDDKEAVITYKEVVALKFSDQSYFSTMRDNPYFPLPNANSVTNPDEFNSGLDKLENYILEKVAFNGVSNTSSSTNRNLYGTGSIDVSRSQTLYGLAHCTGDLSVKNCTQCLRGIMDNYRKSFSGRVGGRVICWSCYFRYETYRFYGPNATSPPFPSPNMNPPPSKPKISRKVFLIIVIVPSVITVLSVLYFCVKGRKKVLERKIEDPIKSTYLNWERRYKIIRGIAKGLLYLHEDSPLKIIHRDLKASNVLLGEDMVPKISDFGMARMVHQNQVSTKRICGTFGYMAPEYAMHGKFSAKSDVFSFGVLILEILCGKRSNSFGGLEGAKNVLSYAWGLWEEGKSIELLDPSLRDCHSTNEVMRCIQIGLLCGQKDVANRPTMAWIIHMLNNHSVALPTPLAPSVLVLHGETEPNIPSKDGENISVNQVSMTEFYPR